MAIARSSVRWLNDLLTSVFGIRVVRAGHRRDDGYHQWHRQSALAAVRALKKSMGCALSLHLRKRADDYAIDVLGGKQYAPWLYVYTLVSGCFKEGWIPDNFFGLHVDPNVNKDLRAVTHLKTFSNVVLKTAALPDIAYHIDGVFYDRELAVIDLKFLREFVASIGSAVFLKKDRSQRGRGLVKLAAGDISEDTFKEIGDCVIQPAIEQHEMFEQIISGSLTTVRITTVRDLDGLIDLRASYLRLGRSDTAWIRSDNSVRVAIVDRRGQLDSFGYTEDWARWRSHPDTQVSFADRCIPQFGEVVQMCVNLHSQVPHLAIIGWDVAIDRDGDIKLLEWNGSHCDIKFSEATTGPCFIGLNWERFAKVGSNAAP
jgi:Sugar-transfer associated ATP-grasp